MLTKLIHLLSALVAYFERLGRARRDAEAQRTREELDEDYRAWWDTHFGGVPDDTSEPTKQADKTDADPR